MPPRIRKIRHDEETRAKIQASQLVNRLTAHVLGKVEMSSTQVTAALGLLKKSLPDLASVDVSGEQTVEHVIVGALPTEAEWIEEHATEH